MSEIDNLVQTKPPGDGHMDLMKEKRKIHMSKIATAIFRLLDKNQDGRISREEFLNAISVSTEVRRFFDRAGFLWGRTYYCNLTAVRIFYVDSHAEDNLRPRP